MTFLLVCRDLPEKVNLMMIHTSPSTATVLKANFSAVSFLSLTQHSLDPRFLTSVTMIASPSPSIPAGAAYLLGAQRMTRWPVSAPEPETEITR